MEIENKLIQQYTIQYTTDVESRTQYLTPRPRTQKKNARVRPRTDFSRTDPLEAKDKNGQDQGQGHNFLNFGRKIFIIFKHGSL